MTVHRFGADPQPANHQTREGDDGGQSVRDALGGVLRDERTEQERTLADVADLAFVSLPYLSEIERGRKDVSSELLESICRSLDVHVADVLERTADRLRVEAVTPIGAARSRRRRSDGGSGIRMLAA